MAAVAADPSIQLRTELGDLRTLVTGVDRATLGAQVFERLLEAVFMSAYTAFEDYLERLFFAIVCGHYQPFGATPVVTFPDEPSARGIVVPTERRYVSWLPIDETIARASRYIRDALPFAQLRRRGVWKSHLRQAQVVRNAIGHRTDETRAAFIKLVDPRYPTPGDYLASASGTGTVCEAFIEYFGRIGAGLAATAEADVANYLGAVDLLTSGAKPGVGTYECAVCSNTYNVADGEALVCPICDPPCPTCGQTITSTARFKQL